MSCPICTEDLHENDCYILPECDHMFHIDCIMSWFRAGNNRCPYCNNPGEGNKKDESNDNYHFSNYFSGEMIKQRVKLIKRHIKKNEELQNDPDLAVLLKKQNEIITKIKENNEKNKIIQNKDGTFKELKNEANKLRRRGWDLNSSLRKVNNKIAAYPIREITVVKKVYIKKNEENK